MYLKIKELADEAIALQNKNAMDAALREISAMTAQTIAARASVTPEKMVIKELAAGKTVLLDGQYVKLVSGDAPALPHPEGAEESGPVAAKTGDKKGSGNIIREGRFPPPEFLGAIVTDKDGNKSFSGAMDKKNRDELEAEISKKGGAK